MPTLTPGTYPSFFDNYLKLVDAETVAEAKEKYGVAILDFVKNIPADKADYRYAEGKWTVKDVLQHVIDTERIFAYRILRIARRDKTSLPGFDQDAYAFAAKADGRSLESLVMEFEAVRKSTDLLLESFTEEDLKQTGTTGNSPNTANAIGFVIFGHLLHHKKILEERYL